MNRTATTHAAVRSQPARGLITVSRQLCGLLMLALNLPAWAATPPQKGMASWYGEEHRGRLMANGRRFNPDRPIAASWFYPLGAKVQVTLDAPGHARRSVVVTITDRGPAKELVNGGRIIDLSHASFRQLAAPDLGLTSVTVERVHRARRPNPGTDVHTSQTLIASQ